MSSKVGGVRVVFEIVQRRDYRSADEVGPGNRVGGVESGIQRNRNYSCGGCSQNQGCQ